MNEIQDRIFLIVKTKDLTSAEFAEAIGVQPSNISHIMSGRNKPSLDFVMKILKRFPEIRSEWLLSNQGSMNRDYSLFSEPDAEKIDTVPKSVQQKLEFEKISNGKAVNSLEKDTITEIPLDASLKDGVEVIKETLDTTSQPEKKDKIHHEEIKNNPHTIYNKKIEKIVIFYEDRTFREYHTED